MRRPLARFLTVLAVLGLVGFLAWRVALVSGEAVRGEGGAGRAPAGRRGRGEPTGQSGGEGTGVTLRQFDEETGKPILIVKARRASIKGEACELEGVSLRRALGGGRGEILAVARAGVYDRKTGSGKLTGRVRLRRLPPGEQKPDITLSGESLAWDHATGRLTSADYVEFSWRDAARERQLEASGRGLVAERWAQEILLRKDVRVSVAAPALPGELKFGRKAGAPGKKQKVPVRTLVTAEGPGTFEYGTDLGCHRALFRNEVTAVRGKVRLSCDELELVILAAEPAAGLPAEPEVAAARSAAAAPLAGAACARWVIAALRPPPDPKPELSAGASAKEETRDPAPKEAGRVDRVLARGTVVLQSPQGTARGELARYDGPARLLWLTGREGEPAELVREGEDQAQVLAERFWFNLATEEMGLEGEGSGSATVIE